MAQVPDEQRQRITAEVVTSSARNLLGARQQKLLRCWRRHCRQRESHLLGWTSQLILLQINSPPYVFWGSMAAVKFGAESDRI